jgi:hypothetical protein
VTHINPLTTSLPVYEHAKRLPPPAASFNAVLREVQQPSVQTLLSYLLVSCYKDCSASVPAFHRVRSEFADCRMNCRSVEKEEKIHNDGVQSVAVYP